MKFQTHKRNLSDKYAILREKLKRKNRGGNKVHIGIELTKPSWGRANRYNGGIRIMEIKRKLAKKDSEKERSRSKIKENTRETNNQEWCHMAHTDPY